MVSRVVAVFCLWLLVLLFALPSHVCAQGGAIDTTFKALGAPNNTVNAILRQGDGKIIVAGDFTSIAGMNKSRIARLNTDGTIDTTFDVGMGPSSSILQMALQSDGKIIVVGLFNSFGYENPRGIARLNSDGSVDTSFNAGSGSDGSLSTVAVQADGRILVGGNFHSFNGDSTRGELTRLNADGSLDSTFLLGSGLNASISSIALQSDGKSIVIGNFSSVGGIARRRVARLNTDGTLDTAYDPGASFSLNSLYTAFQSSGKLVIAASYAGPTLAASGSGLFRLNMDGTIDPTFRGGAGLSNGVRLVVGADDSIVAAGNFTTVDGVSRRNIARFLPNGAVDPLFNAGNTFTGNITALLVQPDGKPVLTPAGMSVTRLLASGTTLPQGPVPIVTSESDGAGVRLMWTAATFAEGYKIERSANGGGSWTLAATTTGESVLRRYDGGLTAGATYSYRVRAYNRYGDGANSAVITATTLPAVWPGQVSLSLDPMLGGVTGPQGFSGYANAPQNCVVTPDGKLIVAVQFQPDTLSSVRTCIVRLNPDGSLDQAYDAVTSYRTLMAMAVQPDGKLLVGGNFSTARGTQSRYLARFNSDGSEDTSFLGQPAGDIYSILVQADGKLVIGGGFQSVNGTARNSIARLNADGSLDNTFDPGNGVTGAVDAMALDSNGRIIVGGNFWVFDGHSVGNLVRLNSDGSFDGTFNAGAGCNSYVTSVAIQPDGQILLAGWFGTYNGATARTLIRVSPDGTLDSTFSYPTNGGTVGALLVQADGRAVISAPFSRPDGSYMAVYRLTSTGALDPTFNTALSAQLDSFCLTSDGRLLTSGTITLADATTQTGLVLLSLTGSAPPPFVPTLTEVKPVAGVRMQVTWSEVSGETGYSIERSPHGTTGWTPVGQSSMDTPTYTDSGLAQNVRYWYRVRAFNASGVSLPSNTLFSQTVQLPVAPTMTARGYGYEEAVLSWMNGAYYSTYVVERSLDGVTGWTAAPVSSLANYLDAGLGTQTSYYYRVKVANSLGDVATGPVVSATTASAGSVVGGSLDPAFVPGAGPQGRVSTSFTTTVSAIVLQGDGKSIVCGEFTSFGGTARTNIARLNPDGSVDPSFNAGAWNSVKANLLALQPDGKVLVAGVFLGSDGYTHANVVRLNTDGTVDSTFDASAAISTGSAFYSGILSLAVQVDGRALVGGNKLVRLDANGVADAAFSPQIGSYSGTSYIYALANAPGGQILISGSFDYVSGSTRPGFARLNSDGTLDMTFAPTNSSSYSGGALCIQPDGKIVRGNSQYSSTAISRYNTDGSLDASFARPAISYPSILYTAALQPDGKILVGGNFTSLGGTSFAGVARLNADGTVDTSFDTGVGETVNNLALQQDGRVLICGPFSSIENQPRNTIARLLGGPVTWDAFQQWKIGYGFSPAIPDGSAVCSDGLSVLAEYALGGNPGASDPAILPSYAADANTIRVTYPRPRADVNCWMETSTDLVNWTTSGVNQGGGGATITASVAATGATKRFVRLHFFRP